MLEQPKNKRTVVVLKYLSLVSLALSVFVYLVHALELEIKTDDFLFLHLTSIITFGSMIIHSLKRKKEKKSKRSLFDFSNIFSDFKVSISVFKKLCQNNKFLVVAVVTSAALLMAFAHYHIHNFMEQVNHLEQIEGPASFIEVASGHWVIFSAIPTVYFFLIVPLTLNWDAAKSEI